MPAFQAFAYEREPSPLFKAGSRADNGEVIRGWGWGLGGLGGEAARLAVKLTYTKEALQATVFG